MGACVCTEDRNVQHDYNSTRIDMDEDRLVFPTNFNPDKMWEIPSSDDERYPEPDVYAQPPAPS